MAGGVSEIESNLGTDVPAPRVQAEPFVVNVADQSEVGGLGG
jgi:hypothetical protein